MNPIFRIIKYLFKKNNVTNTDESIDQFFDNGIAFPQFISLIFNEEVPNITQKPKNKLEKMNNNKKALDFLLHHNEEIDKLSPSFETEQDKSNLLVLILTKQCFTIDHAAILDKCNLILQSLGIKYETVSDLVNKKCLLYLLNELTNIETQVETEKSELNEILPKSFEIAKVPFIIDETSFNTQNKYIFFIQILIIFDHFSDQINQISNIAQNIGQLNKFESTNGNKQNFDERKELSGQDIFDQDVDDYSDSGEFKPINGQNVYQMISKYLLNTLNSIITINKGNDYFLYQFKNLEQSVKGDNLLKFVSLFFKDDPEISRNLNKIVSKIGKNSDKIKEMINFLSNKEPKFHHLVLNFNNPELLETTAYTFYTTFLEAFFIKPTKKELFQRCLLLLSSCSDQNDYNHMFKRCCKQIKHLGYDKIIPQKEKNEEFLTKYRLLKKNSSILKDERYIKDFLSNNENFHYNKVLCDLNAYLNLALITNTKTCKIKKRGKLDERYFSVNNIPFILDKNHLKKYQLIEKPLDAFFYQLIFILNEYDKKDLIYHFKEYSFRFSSILKKTKVPNYLDLTYSIRAKRISRILQNKNVSSKERSIITKMEKSNFKFHAFESCDDDFTIIKSETFELRKVKSKIESKKTNPTNSTKFINSETFWNPNDTKYEFQNEILLDKTQPSGKEWDNEMKTIKNFFVKPPNSPNLRLFNDSNKKISKNKLYKFYHFHEEEKVWKMNSFVIDDFFKENFNNEKIQTKLILFLNSNENEEISMCSQFIDGLFPELSDDSIYVYALCDKTLLHLQYNLISKDDKTFLKQDNIKPIFLLLHIPPNKRNLPNISTIINQLYVFLSFICDIKIMILNRDNYLSQIELMKDLMHLNRNFHKIGNVKSESLQGKNLLSFSSYDLINIDEEEDNVIDDEYDDDQNSDDNYDNNDNDKYSKKKSLNDEMIYSNKYNFFLGFSDNLFKKKSDIIFLINDNNIHNVPLDFESNNSGKLYNYISQELLKENIHFAYINVNDLNTYNIFLNAIQTSCLEMSYSPKDILINLHYILMSEMSSMYIILRRKIEWKIELQKIISDRYEMLKNNNCEELSEFILLTKLFTEIASIYPLIDTEFDEEINKIFTDRINKYLKQYSDIFTKELQISSASNLESISNQIKRVKYISETNKINIINSHKNFLKKEFFSIVKYYSPINEFATIYSKNTEIVEKQIDLDIKEIENYFEKYLKKEHHFNNDNNNRRRTTTNYFLREVENIKEKEVIVESNQKLEDVIEQDF